MWFENMFKCLSACVLVLGGFTRPLSKKIQGVAKLRPLTISIRILWTVLKKISASRLFVHFKNKTIFAFFFKIF